MIIGKITKQPVERIDYDIDFTDFLGTDTLLSSPLPTVVFEPTGELNTDLIAVMTAPPYNSKYLKIWLVDGTNGASYKMTVTVTTSAGRVKQVEVKIKVKDD